MRVLFLDCFSGAAGDMILGALIDAGASLNDVRAGVGALGIEGWELEVSEVRRAGLRAAKAHVEVTDDVTERSYRELTATIDKSRLSQGVRHRVQHTFRLLARAEARVHGVPENDIHFHEVGSLDALVDVAGSCIALDLLRVGRVVVSAVPAGTGRIETGQGTFPLPTPAALEILKEREAPLHSWGRGELVTPTGAALLAAFADEFGDMPPMRIEATGYGAGDRDLAHPNVLRALIGESAEVSAVEEARLIECNLDDMSPELLPHLIETLLDAGAQDAWVTPILMKKGRPAFTLSVLTGPRDAERISNIVFKEATTLGLRRSRVTKEALDRRWVEVDVEGNVVRVKLGLRGGEVVTMAPEHDDAVSVARATGRALKDIYAAALEAAAKRERP